MSHNTISYAIGVVALIPAPPEPPISSVVVSVGARPFPLLVGLAVSVVLLCGSNRCPPSLPGCHDYFDNWREHCAHHPNPIQGRKMLLILRRLWRGFAV